MAKEAKEYTGELLTVDGRGDAVLVARLQTVEDAQDLGRVAAGRGRVAQDKTDRLLGVDDEDGADGEGNTTVLLQRFKIVLRDHVVEVGDVAVGVSDDGKLDGGLRRLVDVFDPFVVRAQVIGTLMRVQYTTFSIWLY